ERRCRLADMLSPRVFGNVAEPRIHAVRRHDLRQHGAARRVQPPRFPDLLPRLRVHTIPGMPFFARQDATASINTAFSAGLRTATRMYGAGTGNLADTSFT